LTHPKPKSFWEEAASRAHGDSVRVAMAEEAQKERKSLLRDPPPAPATPPPLVPTDDPLRLRLAEELDYARRILSLMGDDLCGDPAIVVRHGTALQSVDILGQMLGHVANVIRCTDPEEAVDRIGMGELRARLQRRGGV
jgi:hypothetical protein